jgi:hypothetical protein
MLHHIWLIAAVGGVAAIAIAGFAMFQHREARAVVVARVSEPRSFVEVLTTQAAVADAARRAASFERDAAARANGRAEHYEALAVSEAVQDFDATVSDIGQRSAS